MLNVENDVICHINGPF